MFGYRLTDVTHDDYGIVAFVQLTFFFFWFPIYSWRACRMTDGMVKGWWKDEATGHNLPVETEAWIDTLIFERLNRARCQGDALRMQLRRIEAVTRAPHT